MNISATDKIEPIEAKYDPSLDTSSNEVLFHEKLKMATELYKKYAMPQKENRTKKQKQYNLSTLQIELLSVFSIDPTEKQMQELKAFLHQLFGEELIKVKAKQEKMVA